MGTYRPCGPTIVIEGVSGMAEVDEVERLRARVRELETQLTTTSPEAHSDQPVSRSMWRSVVSLVAIVLACVLAPLSVASVWASTQISDTDQYVETVAPLADDPSVQTAIADEVTGLVLARLDVEQLTTDALAALAEQENVPPRVSEALPALAVPISTGFEDFARTQVRNVVASPEFATVWASVNRIAHEQVVKLLEGNQGGAVSADGDAITFNLAPIVEQVKTRLVSRGFTLAQNIPVVDRSFVLVQSDTIRQTQTFYRSLDLLGTWLPLVALVLFTSGVILARDRRRALLRGALGVVMAMIVLGVLLAVGRMLYVQSTPADVLTEQAAGNVFDTLVRFLRTGLRAAAVLGLVVATAAFLTGPSPAAVWTRRSLGGGIASLRGSAEGAGWRTGGFGTWVYAHRTHLRIGIVAAGGLVLMFWARPTVGVVLATALVVVLALAVLEFLGRPPLPGPSARRTDAAGVSTVDTGAPRLAESEPVSSSERDDAVGGVRT
jgi:hypothetical protein